MAGESIYFTYLFFMVSTKIIVHMTTIALSADIELTIMPASAGPEPKVCPTPMETNSTAPKIMIPKIK